MKTTTSLIVDHPFLGSFSREHLDLILEHAVDVQFEPGEVIFKENDPANRFYLIEYGKVTLETHLPHDGDIVVQTLAGGDVVGWSWLFPPFAWHFRARALEPTSAIVIDGAHLLGLCERNHDLGFELMKRMAQVVIQRLQATRRQWIYREGASKAA